MEQPMYLKFEVDRTSHKENIPLYADGKIVNHYYTITKQDGVGDTPGDIPAYYKHKLVWNVKIFYRFKKHHKGTEMTGESSNTDPNRNLDGGLETIREIYQEHYN